MDAVLALRPFEARAFAAPGLDEVAGVVEHQDCRRRLSLFGLERARPLQHPDIVLRVDADAGGIGEPPLRRHLGPRAGDLEHRHGAGLCIDLRPLHPGENDQCCENDKTPRLAWHRYLPSLLICCAKVGTDGGRSSRWRTTISRARTRWSVPDAGA